MEIKNRCDIDEKYKWDLSKLTDICEKRNDIFLETKKLTEKLKSYKGKIGNSPKNLFDALELSTKISRNLENLYVYAFLKHYEDTQYNNAQEYKNKVYKFYNEITEEISFFDVELLNIDYKIIEKYVLELKELEKYKFYLEKAFRYKKYTLSESEEKILSALSPVINSSKETFNSLDNTDLTFDKIKDENGNLVDFSNELYTKYISSNDRRVRKEAFELLYKEYAKHKNTIAQTYITNIKKDAILSRLRGYNSSLEASLYKDSVDIKVYKNLIDIVNKNLDKLHKFFSIKKKCLNLDEMHMYDVYASSASTFNKEYSFEEAKDIIINALNVLGQDYVNILCKAFDEKWVDVMPNKYKRTGAYSWGTYDSNPVLMLNYDNTINSVGTLAHELGHSIHSYLSNSNQDYLYHSYPIILAEIASTVNEVLLADYMLKNSKDKQEKEYILNDFLDSFRGTLYRQTMFAEFEYIVHEKEENNETLTEKALSDIYYDLNKKYYGDDIVSDDEIRYEWARIPHFYNSFYVYKYATGLSIACIIASDIINKKDGALDNYIKFLSSGSSNYPLEILKECGYDLSDPKVIENAFTIFDKYLFEYENLIEGEKN
ncbi:MAG: oligoendopeptidase F [Bacilli bacterium]|nr:oligoendopeptidase F [Bacilli bacterium]